ncbi:MAG: carbonic anhydrase [Clostridiales bacterium]|nr:carbonic anhydrase [Clostridiales bacterium]
MADEALVRLKKGNLAYLNAKTGLGDISPETRKATSENGQKPYAVVITCSDSRVIPEYIFSAGLGELFVVRVAGNVIDDHALGSIEYAVEHLGCKLVLVLGHTRCGAVGAAFGKHKSYIGLLADEIKCAIGTETDAEQASILNIKHSVAKIQKLLKPTDDVFITGALYRTESGEVDFAVNG